MANAYNVVGPELVQLTSAQMSTPQTFAANPNARTNLPPGSSFYSQSLQPLPTYYPTPLSSNVGPQASRQGVHVPSFTNDELYTVAPVPMVAEAVRMAKALPAKLAAEWDRINNPQLPSEPIQAIQGNPTDIHPFALTMSLPYVTEMATSIFCNKNVAMLNFRLWQLLAIRYGQSADWALKMATFTRQSETGMIIALNIALGIYMDFASSMTARQFFVCVCGWAMDQQLSFWTMDIDYGISEAHGQANAVTNPQLFTPLKPYLRGQGSSSSTSRNGAAGSSTANPISARPTQQNSAYPSSSSQLLAPFDISQAAVFNSFLGTPGVDGYVGGEIGGRGNATFITQQNPLSEAVPLTGDLKYIADAQTWNGRPVNYQRDDLAVAPRIDQVFGGGGGAGIYQASAVPTWMTYDGGPYPYAPVLPNAFGYTAPGTAPPNGFGPPLS